MVLIYIITVLQLSSKGAYKQAVISSEVFGIRVGCQERKDLLFEYPCFQVHGVLRHKTGASCWVSSSKGFSPEGCVNNMPEVRTNMRP